MFQLCPTSGCFTATVFRYAQYGIYLIDKNTVFRDTAYTLCLTRVFVFYCVCVCVLFFLLFYDAAATLSGNSLRQTAHTHCASVHQAAKLVAAFLRVAGITAGLREVMAAYRRVYDSRHLQADCQEPGSAPGPYAR